jgi:WD40 repeat protein/class 3 adenylate cyclase
MIGTKTEAKMLQIRLLGQFDVRLGGKRILIASRPGQSLLAFLAMTAGTPHRREKLAGTLWPDTSDENARKNLRQELWRIRKAIPTQNLTEADGYLLADELTLTFNQEADYWLDVAILEKPDVDIQSLTSSLSLYQGELLPGFYDDWVVLERERLQTLFESKMEQLVEKLVELERWTAVQEQCERWLSLGPASEPAYRALMLSYNARGDMAKVGSIYQRCVEDLRDHFGVEPSVETQALFNGLLKGAKVPRRILPPQPSGTVTFLFTDIQGSTRLLDKLGDQYATSLAEHHHILRAAIQKWKGTEMDTQGDAFFVIFPRALDAVQCAVEAQHELANHNWLRDEPIRVRMGLHTGEPLIASTGYVGMDVHRAARIGDAGHGGQVLLSQTTQDLVVQDLPPGITLKNLGEHRLKDMKYPTPIYQLVIEGLQTEFPPLKTKFTGGEAPVPGDPPFKGLQYFDESDSDLFFGREVLTKKLLQRLQGEQFLSVIIGASGSGKSSLVRAGLIPALKKGGTPVNGTKVPEGSRDWHIHTITPTVHPLEALATELTRDLDSVAATARLIDDLAQEPRSLALFFARAGAKQQTVLVVDQFEELFTLCRDEFEREAFIDNLLALISPGQSSVKLIITLRADFYAHLAQYPELREAVSQQQEYIGPMTADELRRAIEEPARRGHWEFEPGLVDLILRDVGDEPGALPLLSHALLETWKRRAGYTLTLKGYADAGGVHGAIAHTAESIYQSLSIEDQEIARDVFLRLTELGEGTEDTRRRASFEELTSHAEHMGEVRHVLNLLADARLITLGEETAEVAHEALIREWPTLREWLNRDREGLRLHRHLTEAAYEWELLGRDAGALYRGAHLSQAREWAALHPNALNIGEREFLAESINQERREEQEREEGRQRELAAAKELAEAQGQSASRLRIRNRVITTVGSIALILALLAGLFGVRAESNFNRAEAQRLALEANRLLLSRRSSEPIALLSLRSMKLQYTPEGDAALAAAARLDYPLQLFPYTSIVWVVAFSPDGKYILTGHDDSTARLWDAQSGKELRVFTGGHTAGINKLYFSPDGKNILTASFDKSLILWDTATGREIYRITTEPELSNTIFSHDGKYIFTISADQKVRRWDAESGKEIGVIFEAPEATWRIFNTADDKYMLTIGNMTQLWDLDTGQKVREFSFDPAPINRFGLSPDGNLMVTGGTDGVVRLWDTKSGSEIRRFVGHTTILYAVAFSPDKKYILTAGADNTARVWDINTGREIRRIICPDLVNTIVLSPDGEWLLTGSNDGITRLWNFDASLGLPILNQVSGVGALEFSPDGKLIATGGVDGTVRVWDAATGQTVHDLKGHADSINFGVAFSPNGKFLVTTSWDKTVRLWDAQTGEEVRQLVGHTDSVNGVAFSPDGKYIATAGYDAVRIWDAKTGHEIRQFSEIRGVMRAAFSPDGKYLLTAAAEGAEGKPLLWDVATGRLIREYQAPVRGMNSAIFSPDGKLILTDGEDGIARLWNVETAKEIRQFIGHTDRIWTAVFSPDGKYIATSSADNTARLWDTQTGQELRRFTGHTAGVNDVAFSPDGEYILTGSDDGTAMLWDVDYRTTMKYLCSRLLRDFTDEERAQYGIADTSPTCP